MRPFWFSTYPISSLGPRGSCPEYAQHIFAFDACSKANQRDSLFRIELLSQFLRTLGEDQFASGTHRCAQ